MKLDTLSFSSVWAEILYSYFILLCANHVILLFTGKSNRYPSAGEFVLKEMRRQLEKFSQ